MTTRLDELLEEIRALVYLFTPRFLTPLTAPRLASPRKKFDDVD